MHLREFDTKTKVKIGVKQTSRAIADDQALTVYIAKDADQYVTRRVAELAEEHSVKVVLVDTMKELGRACKIDVGAATAVIVK